MKRAVEFDWIIEHENLPEDSPLLSEPLHPDPTSLRQPVRRAWLLIGLIGTICGILVVLWTLGGKIKPLPSPDSPTDRLQVAIQLEIDALERGDLEIFNRFQDRSWRRSIMQPPVAAWITSQGSNSLELVEAELIDDSSAWARIRMYWDQISYDLIWFYRYEDGRWLHGDFQDMPLGPTETVSLPNVQISYQQTHQTIAAALAARLEVLIENYCLELECPTERISVKVAFDPLIWSYYAQEIAPLSYRIPSPVRIRWPTDAQPEPLVLTSLGRHIAYDLFARPHESRVSLENHTALTLASFWLAHHHLGHEPVPTTRWLEEATRQDGLRAAAAYMMALSRDQSHHSALLSSFQPETVTLVQALPDYYGWLTLVTDPADLTRPMPGPNSSLPIRWYQDLHTRLDFATNPWVVGEGTYGQSMPEMKRLLRHPSWVIAIPTEGSDWGAAYYFTSSTNGWTLDRPDENLMGEQRSERCGPFFVRYWAWDEENLDQILSELDKIHRVVSDSLDLRSDQELSVVLFSSPDVMSAPPFAADLYLSSPALSDLLDRDIDPDPQKEIQDAVAALILNEFEETPDRGYYIIYGIYHWQVRHLERELDTRLSPEPEMDLVRASWHPPSDLDARDWRSLADMWPPPPGTAETELYLYGILLVAYLVETYGEDSLPAMLAALSSSETMAEWVTAVSGRPIAPFEEEWRRWAIDF